MLLQVPHFKLSSSHVFVNFGQNERFSEKQIYFWKKWIFYYFPQKSTENMRMLVCNYSCEKNQKKSAFRFLPIFFIFSKNPKISNLSRVKAPELQNNVIVDMKTALDGGKKVKTQLFRRRGHRKIQQKSYLTSKKL